MTLFEAIVLGVVQGLTEFIPISSSGHLVITQYLFGLEIDHLFLEAINIGTFVALLVYFRNKIITIIKDVLLNKKFVLARNILLTAIPAGVIGFLYADFIASAQIFNNVIAVAVALLIVGVVMILSERISKPASIEGGDRLSIPRAVIVGIAQVAAFFPGVSRSGSTILAGRFVGLTPEKAAEYSFLVSLPIMAGVTLKILLFDTEYLRQNGTILLFGNIAAFIAGILAVGFLMKYLSRHSLAVFGWYRVAIAVIALLAVLL